MGERLVKPSLICANVFNCEDFLNSRSNKRFLVVSPLQLILVEPDTSNLGWGIVRFVAFLQVIEFCGKRQDEEIDLQNWHNRQADRQTETYAHVCHNE
jgi:hypothetical protein